VSAAVLYPVQAVLDTGAGINLVREDVLPTGWEKMLLPNVTLPRITNASGRRMPSRGVIILHVQVGDLLKRVRFYVTPTTCEWASPIVLVPKSDGSLRFCVDYRRLNAITVTDTNPLPRMDEFMDSAALSSSLHWIATVAIGNYRFIRTTATKRRSLLTMEYTVFYGCRLDFGMLRPPSRGQLTLSSRG
jgi:hypothetical protein